MHDGGSIIISLHKAQVVRSSSGDYISAARFCRNSKIPSHSLRSRTAPPQEAAAALWTTKRQMDVLYSASVQACRRPTRERARAMWMTEQRAEVLYSAPVRTRRTPARDTARAIWTTQHQEEALYSALV